MDAKASPAPAAASTGGSGSGSGSSGGVWLSYYCTVIPGLEYFATDELRTSLAATDIQLTDVCPGKVLFRSNRPIADVRRLLSVEHVYYRAGYVTASELKLNESDSAASYRRLAEVASAMDWDPVITAWKRDVLKADDPMRGVAFRMSCQRGGEHTKQLHSQKLSAAVGVVLYDRMVAATAALVAASGKAAPANAEWSVNLAEPELDISVVINDHFFLIGLPVTDTRLSAREYTTNFTLRSSVAYCLSKLAAIPAGSVVCDPLCGRGGLLLESAKHVQPNAVYLASDLDDKQVAMCEENIHAARLVGAVSALYADATSLPYRTGSVDIVLSDIPFGQAHGSTEYNRTLYPRILAEFYRICGSTATAILLTSRSMERVIHRAIMDAKCWTCTRTFSLKLGTVKAHALVLTKGQPHVNLHLLRNNAPAAPATTATTTATATAANTTASAATDTKSAPAVAAADDRVASHPLWKAKTAAELDAQRAAGDRIRAERAAKREQKLKAAVDAAKAAGATAEEIAKIVAASAAVPVPGYKSGAKSKIIHKQTRAPKK